MPEGSKPKNVDLSPPLVTVEEVEVSSEKAPTLSSLLPEELTRPEAVKVVQIDLSQVSITVQENFISEGLDVASSSLVAGEATTEDISKNGEICVSAPTEEPEVSGVEGDTQNDCSLIDGVLPQMIVTEELKNKDSCEKSLFGSPVPVEEEMKIDEDLPGELQGSAVEGDVQIVVSQVSGSVPEITSQSGFYIFVSLLVSSVFI